MNNSAFAQSSGYEIIEENGKKGLTYYEKIVAPVEYDNILAAERTSDVYILDENGKVVSVECVREEASDYILEKNGKKGLVSFSGIVVPAEYDDILVVNNPEYYIIEKDSKKGLASSTGIQVPVEYDNIFVNSSGYILAKGDIIKTSYGKTYKVKNFNPSTFTIKRNELIISKQAVEYYIEYDGKRIGYKINPILKVLLIPIDIPITICNYIYEFLHIGSPVSNSDIRETPIL